MQTHPEYVVRRPDFPVLGVRVSSSSLAEVVERVVTARDRPERLRVHFVTAHTLVEAHDDCQLRAELNAADVVAPDGMPLVWLGRLGGTQVERVCGPDAFPLVLEAGVSRGLRHYFYGGEEGVAEELRARMTARFPRLAVVGSDSPPFRALTETECDAAIERLNAAEPDCVWVGLGSPKQDLWAAQYRDRLSAAAVLTVGAAFDFHAGGRRRAPAWMQRSGLEWVHRFASDPQRLAGRYSRVNARFVWLVLREQVGRICRRTLR